MHEHHVLHGRWPENIFCDVFGNMQSRMNPEVMRTTDEMSNASGDSKSKRIEAPAAFRDYLGARVTEQFLLK